MLISNKGKKFLTGRPISYLCGLWARPGSNIFKNFFNKKFLDLFIECTLKSAGHSENIDIFRSLSIVDAPIGMAATALFEHILLS